MVIAFKPLVERVHGGTVDKVKEQFRQLSDSSGQRKFILAAIQDVQYAGSRVNLQKTLAAMREIDCYKEVHSKQPGKAESPGGGSGKGTSSAKAAVRSLSNLESDGGKTAAKVNIDGCLKNAGASLEKTSC